MTAASMRRLRGNHQGSIVALADNAGAPIAINAYDEWGIPAASNVGRFQYTGQIWLPELGLYYYKARIYSPTLGRFMQTDPIGYEDQVNLYAYVGNDPVNGTDPTGKDTEVQFTQAAGVQIPNICGAGGCSGPSPLHTNLKLTPDIQKGLDPKIFSQIDSDGRRFATLSAGPDDLPIFGFSNLVSEVNRGEGPTVHKMNIRTPSIFRSEADFHSALLNSDKNYNDRNPYVLFPQKGDAGRNSNSYISGILRANSVDTTGIGKSGYYVPGFDVPLDVAAGSIRR